MRQRFDLDTVQDWLYVIIVGSLALYLVIGVVAWSWMILAGIPTPDAFATVLAAIIGGFVGILTPLRPPQRTSSSGDPASPGPGTPERTARSTPHA